MRPWPCGIWAIRTRRYRRAEAAAPGPRAVVIPTAWPSPGFCCLLHQLRRERHLTQEQAEAAITLASEQGFPLWLGHRDVLQGWALAEQGQSEEGISPDPPRPGHLPSHRGRVFQSYFLALLAEAYGKAGQAEEGLAVLAEALAVVDKTASGFTRRSCIGCTASLRSKSARCRVGNRPKVRSRPIAQSLVAQAKPRSVF